MHLRAPSIALGVRAFVWAVVFLVILYVGMVALGVTRGTSFLLAVALSFLIFLFFIVCGDLMLEALHIPMASFQMAGALILLLFGLQMTLGKVTEAALAMPANASLSQRAIFPLAMPCIAGAGSIMTVMLLTDNHDRSFSEQLQTTGVLLTCLMLQLKRYRRRGITDDEYFGRIEACRNAPPPADDTCTRGPLSGNGRT